MSQRMTDEAVANARRDAGAALDLDCECDPDAHEPGCFEHEAGTAFVALETDHDRARSEEARLLEDNRSQAEQLRQKDAQIQALADALRRAEPFITDGETAAAVDAALRLAGRVK